MHNELKAGALFAGIGGFCLGFEQAGIKTVWAVENNPASVQTYQHNISTVRVVMDGASPASIKNVTVNEHKLEPVDVLHAGFPCQSFSVAGDRRGFEDERGMLFYEIIRLVDALTTLLYQSDVRANIVERPTTSQCLNIFSAILRRLNESYHADKRLFDRNLMREAMKKLNLVGGVKLLGVLPEQQVNALVAST